MLESTRERPMNEFWRQGGSTGGVLPDSILEEFFIQRSAMLMGMKIRIAPFQGGAAEWNADLRCGEVRK
jgi:hypothetical protein